MCIRDRITAGPTTLQDMSGNYSTANLEPGDVLTVEQLLYCLLLPSANEAGNILAVAVDGSIEAFVEHMNTRAKELGCKGTHFVNPHGLHDPDHYTTAYDISPVSYTHLDVYKRQAAWCSTAGCSWSAQPSWGWGAAWPGG